MRRTTVIAAFGLALLAPMVARADEAAGHYNLGLQYKREGKTAEAIGECLSAIKLRPDYAAAHLTLGNLYRATGDYQKAAGEYEITVKLQPKDALAHANLGAAYARIKRPDDGIRELETSIGIADDYDAEISLGMAYKQKGDYKHAIEHDEKATTLKPNEAQGWANLGIVKSVADDKEGAIAAYRKALALKPNDAELHFGLGVIYRRQRKTDEAIAEYLVAVQNDPHYAKAYYDLGVMYSQERKGPEARAAFEKYLEYGAHEDAEHRKDAEDRLKTFKGYSDGQAAHK
jgi:tetratricopeptide (TPR) repeat protein